MRFFKTISFALVFFWSAGILAQEDVAWDKTKIDQMNETAKNISPDMPDSALSITRQSLTYSNKISYKSGIKEALLIKGIAFRVLGQFDSATRLFDSLAAIYKNDKDSSLLGDVIYQQGQLAYDKGETQEGLALLETALQIRKNIDDSAGLTQVYNIMGNSFADLGNYYQALEVYQKALTIDINTNNKIGEASRYNNIARIYTFQKEFEKATEYYQKAYDLAVLLNALTDQAIYANNLAYLLKLQGRYEEALHSLNNALKIHREENTECRDMYPMYNKGSIYVIQNRLDSAEYYLNKVLPKTLTCESDNYLRSLTLIDLGKLFIKKSDFNTGKGHLLEAYQIASVYKLIAEKMAAAYELAAVYDSLNNADRSLSYFKVYNSLNDSLYNAENTRRIARLEAQFEFEKQKREEELARKLEEAEKERQLANAIWVRNSFIVGFLVMGVISFLIYRNYTRKLRANKKLNELNIQITQQKEELEAQAEELTSANEEITRINENLEQIVQDRTKVITQQNQKILEYVFYNSHQVRGPLARILGLVSLFDKKGITENEIQDKLHELRQEAVELDEMVKKMNRTLEKGKQDLKKQRDIISNA